MTQLEKIMKNLKCSEEEARQILQDDKEINQGKRKDFDLPPDQEKEAKKYAHCGTRKTTETKRRVKENPIKTAIISDIYNFLSEKGYENCEIANKNKEITFAIGENHYSINLIEHRKPKN